MHHPLHSLWSSGILRLSLLSFLLPLILLVAFVVDRLKRDNAVFYLALAASPFVYAVFVVTEIVTLVLGLRTWNTIAGQLTAGISGSGLIIAAAVFIWVLDRAKSGK